MQTLFYSLAVSAAVLLAPLPATPVRDDTVDLSEVFLTNHGEGFSGICFHDGSLYAVDKDNALVRYDPLTGRRLSVIDPLIDGLAMTHLHGITVGEGGTFWVGEVASRKLYQLSFADFSVVSILDAPADPPSFGLAFKDGMLWFGHHSAGPTTLIRSMDPQTGEIVDVFDLGVADVHGLAWVGDYLWVLDNFTDKIHRVDANGQVLNSYGFTEDWYGSMTHDGTHFWTTSRTTFLHIDLSGAPCPEPGDVRELAFPGNSSLTWQTPLALGGTPVGYDVLRSEDAEDFLGAGVCLETNDADTEADDADLPVPGGVFHYLIRAENFCPSGTGTLGSDSNGLEREGLDCS